MKKILVILSLILSISIFSSCAYETYAQTEDVTVIVRYGTPYYSNGALVYYVYNNLYYYPYVYNNHTYFHRYRRPLPPPRRHDYRPPMPPQNRGGHFGRPSQPPRNNGTIRPSTPSRGDRPMRGNTRPNFGGRR